MEEYFKKFIDDLEKRENEQKQKKKRLEKDESVWPVREREKRLREDPRNRTRWGK